MMRAITASLVIVMIFFLAMPVSAAEKNYVQLYRKGVEYNKKGNYPEAIRYYTLAIRSKNDSADLYFVRGRAYKQIDKLDEAINDLTRAITLNPAYAEAFNHRGVTYIGKGDLKAAKKDFEKACSMGHKDACANLKQLNTEKKR
jgi:tetratricopeptide (TPR) repeat protein